jgi:hypothetical protein
MNIPLDIDMLDVEESGVADIGNGTDAYKEA